MAHDATASTVLEITAPTRSEGMLIDEGVLITRSSTTQSPGRSSAIGQLGDHSRHSGVRSLIHAPSNFQERAVLPILMHIETVHHLPAPASSARTDGTSTRCQHTSPLPSILARFCSPVESTSEISQQARGRR